MDRLNMFEPKEVFRHFETISRIPRGSGNEAAISGHIKAWAEAMGLWTCRDEANNVIIKKPGSPGRENHPPVILQGHLDMVNEKNMDTVHDFMKDPIDICVDGDFVKAKGTTLGGDNGIAVAYAMALLEGSYVHPPLEVVLTTGEEVGMYGAAALDGSLFAGTMLINMDSEEEGIFYLACAGGLKADVVIDVCPEDAPFGKKALYIRVMGLKGGHSGMEIDKERGNANQILGRVLHEISQKFPLWISFVSGGIKDNAIPREAETVILAEDGDTVKEILEDFLSKLKYEYRMTDPELDIVLKEEEEYPKRVFSGRGARTVIDGLLLLPNGVLGMSGDFLGIVETSCNLGVVKTPGETCVLTCAVRSMIRSRKAMVLERIRAFCDLAGARLVTKADYPSWEYNPQSNLREVFVRAYKEFSGQDATVTAVHAGLECGLFAEKIPGVDMISFGPQMYDVHTPEEKLSISSTERTWRFLLKVLEEL